MAAQPITKLAAASAARGHGNARSTRRGDSSHTNMSVATEDLAPTSDDDASVVEELFSPSVRGSDAGGAGGVCQRPSHVGGHPHTVSLPTHAALRTNHSVD